MADWRWAQASVIGSSHERDAIPCQDRHECRLIPGGDAGPILIAVVSDGAGSAPRAAEGAEVACRTFVELVTETLNDDAALSLSCDVVRTWIASTRARIAAQAEADEHNIHDYATTLLAAILRPNDSIFVQIGDGVIVVQDEESRRWNWVFWPDHGEYVNTTSFLTDMNALDRVQITLSTKTITDLAIMSDGLEHLVLHFSDKSVYEPFFDRNIVAVRSCTERGCSGFLSEALARYLTSSGFRQHADDDITLILASRDSGMDIPSTIELATGASDG